MSKKSVASLVLLLSSACIANAAPMTQEQLNRYGVEVAVARACFSKGFQQELFSTINVEISAIDKANLSINQSRIEQKAGEVLIGLRNEGFDAAWCEGQRKPIQELIANRKKNEQLAQEIAKRMKQ